MSYFLALVVAGAGVVASPGAGAAEPAQAQAQTPAPAPAQASAESPVLPVAATESPERVADPAEVAADALVVRPLGLASTVVGAAIYVVALPFAAIAGDVRGPARSLVGAPAKFTFKRRLGEF